MVVTYNWRRVALVLAIGYGVFYLATLGIRPLARLDEFRYAEIAREMLVTGDWVTPRLNGIRYFEKPILGHWVNAASLAAFGENEFAARLPGALSTGLTVLFICAFLRRATGRPESGVLAAFVYLTSLAVWGIGGIDILDPLLNLFLTAAVGLYFLTSAEERPAARFRGLLAVGLCCGLAFLTKGFLALAIPVLIVGPFLAWQRRWSRLLTDAWLPLLVAACVALPWGLLVHNREPDFWRYFFWEEHIRRFFSAQAQHSGPVWLFAAALPVMAIPWTFAIPAALAGLRFRVADRPLVVFLCLWFVMPFLFFSASEGKLLTYILPCFPPLAMLVALGLEARLGYDGSEIPRPLFRGPGLLRLSIIGLGLLFAAGLAYLLISGFGMTRKPLYGPGETARWLAALAALGWGLCLAAIGAGRQAAPASRVWLMGASVVGLFLALPFALPDSARASKMPAAFLAREKTSIAPDAVLVSYGSMIRSVGWVFKRSDVYVVDPGELRYGLGYPDAAGRLLEPAAVGRLIQASQGTREVAIITRSAEEAWLLPYLPPAARRAQQWDFVLWHIPIAPQAGAGNP